MSSNALRVATTGGSGRVGQHVVRELVARGHHVTNIDRRAGDTPAQRFVYADIRKREQIQPILENVDALIHMAEIPHAQAPFSNDEIFSSNITGTAVVLQTAAELKLKRAIYTSSCQAYGIWGGPAVPPLYFPIDEKHPLRPQNVYGLSKQVNEMFCDFLSRTTGLSIAIFRLPGVIANFGDWTFRWMESRAERVEEMVTHVAAEDVAIAYAMALENPRPGCEVYNLAAADASTLVPLRERFEKFNPEMPPLPADWPDFKAPLATEKFREHFGWQPKWNPRTEYFKWKESQKK